MGRANRAIFLLAIGKLIPAKVEAVFSPIIQLYENNDCSNFQIKPCKSYRNPINPRNLQILQSNFPFSRSSPACFPHQRCYDPISRLKARQESTSNIQRTVSIKYIYIYYCYIYIMCIYIYIYYRYMTIIRYDSWYII